MNVCREALEKVHDSNQVELIDLRIINPFDAEIIVKSVEKTGNLMVVDGGWKSTGLGSEVIAAVSESIKVPMRKNPIRITLPNASAPTSRLLEKSYYLSADVLAAEISEHLKEQS